jgi:hypothetical protein
MSHGHSLGSTVLYSVKSLQILLLLQDCAALLSMLHETKRLEVMCVIIQN